jgi:hypothetical protein
MSSTTSSPASSPRSRLHLLVYSDNRGLHRHPLSLCTLQPSWRPSLLVSSSTCVKLFLLVPLFARAVLATPVLAFVPDAFLSLASSVAAHRPCVPLRVLGFGTTGVCVHPHVHLVLAKPWPHLVLDGSDCIDFGIALLDDCLDASMSFYGALRACGLICGYLDIGTQPRHRPW